MKKIIFLLSMLSSILLAEDPRVISVDKKTLQIHATDAVVGLSGVVIHKINEDFETIVARVEVIKIEDGTVTMRILPYKDLEQDALPRLKSAPEPGDRVKLSWLHHRSLLIAPTLNAYNALTQDQSTLTFIHSDLFAAFLSYEGHPRPLKVDFQNFCKQYDIGLLQIAVDKKLYKVDCSSFSILKTDMIEEEGHTKQKPFYTRVKDIDADWWGEGSKPIEDYDKYYLKLLGQSHAG